MDLTVAPFEAELRKFQKLVAHRRTVPLAYELLGRSPGLILWMDAADAAFYSCHTANRLGFKEYADALKDAALEQLSRAHHSPPIEGLDRIVSRLSLGDIEGQEEMDAFSFHNNLQRQHFEAAYGIYEINQNLLSYLHVGSAVYAQHHFRHIPSIGLQKSISFLGRYHHAFTETFDTLFGIDLFSETSVQYESERELRESLRDLREK